MPLSDPIAAILHSRKLVGQFQFLPPHSFSGATLTQSPNFLCINRSLHRLLYFNRQVQQPFAVDSQANYLSVQLSVCFSQPLKRATYSYQLAVTDRTKHPSSLLLQHQISWARMAPTAIAKVNGITIAESDLYEKVEDNIYVSRPNWYSFSIPLLSFWDLELLTQTP